MPAGITCDAVFVDWQMPGLDGWQTSQRIRQLGLTGEAPVVVMGATNRPKDVDRAILRRMPATFHIGLPSKEQRISIFRRILVPAFLVFHRISVIVWVEFFVCPRRRFVYPLQ